MFIFWGPFFFFFPALIIYLVIRSLTASRDGSRGGGFFGPQRPLDPFGGYVSGQEDTHALRVKVYKLAYRLKGRVTVSDIVVETGLDVEEAEKLIESMVDNQRVRMEVKDSGMIVYEFPEFLARYEEERGSR
jgi:hypothetical protein